jgi:hypothetical protein
MDMNSTAKRIHKTMGSRITGKEVTHSRRTGMEDRMRLTRMDTTKPTARTIDNMTHEVNNDQAEEGMCRNPMDMGILGMAMLVDTTMMLVCRIDSTILGTSNDQKEADTRPRMVQDHRDHHPRQIKVTEMKQDLKDNHRHQTRTTEVKDRSLEDLAPGTATLSNGRTTEVKVQCVISRSLEVATVSKEMAVIDQRNVHRRRSRTAGLVRASHNHRSQR